LEAAPPLSSPRYFWRRLLAYGIDATLCWIIIAILFALFGSEDFGEGQTDQKTKITFGARYELGQFRPPLYVGTETCGTPTEIWPDLHAMVAPETITSAEICFDRQFGLPTEGKAVLQLNSTETAQKSVTVPLNLTGNIRFADLFTFGLFMALNILFMRLYQTTPGKKLMGLRVNGTTPIPAFRREVVRNLPNILMVAVVAALSEGVNAGLMPLAIAQPVAIGIQIIAICAALVLWVWPLLRWRGAMFHDTWSGLVVRRAIPQAGNTD
jgi:RDD family